jgi:hypothetical protein
MDEQEYCAFCRFSLKWQGPRERHAKWNDSSGDIVCRRHAPTKRPDDGYGHVLPVTKWPAVSNMDWCGDFERTEAERWQ